MQSGMLFTRVKLQARSDVQDSLGGQSQVWTDIAAPWVAMAPLQGNTLIAAQALHTETTSQITVRYSALFAEPKKVATYRVSYKTRLFDILGMINVEERNRTVILFCKEGLNDG